ncbi:porin family protein [Aquimarina sp. MMG015]|uniref:outer membrane protein n=1 Tax=Aquimarina sp. MMG015 TaxID=2822689 RepID=UPI001B39D6D2|nr:outer membrane beta-barrel protein [Aquimarina sp. MMG015]MBQ4804838.1 porin family protein [Aquimarina sp. MMG015]
MKKSALLVVILISCCQLFSQDSKISFELNYPIPFGDNFLGDNYVGIIDVGADYRFVKLTPVKIGASLNGNILINDKFETSETTAYILQPRIFGELTIESIKKLRPSVGIGYTVMILDSSITTNTGELNDTETLNGFNLNVGMAYNITKKFFAQIQYDFIRLSEEDNVPDIAFNRNANLLKIGLGYRL